MFGVQSSKVLQQDAARNRPWLYVIIALVLVGLFVILVLTLAHSVIA
ncbi:MAG: DUF2970 domain-containing protein [Legionellales bacterium]|nr:MAG: DUF2970 domain-containing protein [Legionellales bacterium]